MAGGGPRQHPPRDPTRRRPGLGGALRPTRADAEASHEVIFDYSQRLNQQVVALESENLELQDAKKALAAENRSLSERVDLLEKDSAELREAGFATFQERNLTVGQAQDVLRSKQGEVMLLRHTSEQQRIREEQLAMGNAQLQGIAERLQGERSHLQRTVLGLEATASAMHAEIQQQGQAEAHAALIQGDLERRVNMLTVDKMRLDEEMGVRHVEAAQLRLTQEELNAERQHCRRLREELDESLSQTMQLREEGACLVKSVTKTRAEVAYLRRAGEVAATEPQRLQEALQCETALSAGLRVRISELENIIGELRRARTAVDAESSTLRSELTKARAQVECCMGASNRLVTERTGVEQLADAEATRRVQVEKRAGALAEESSRLRAQSDVLKADNARLLEKAQRLEAENVMLSGQVRGAEVVVKGLRSECNKLNMQKAPLPQQAPLPLGSALPGVAAALRGDISGSPMFAAALR